jgi:hypothetical protein
VIQAESLLDILGTILHNHFGYLPSILKGSRKELVDSSLKLIAEIRLHRFDSYIESFEMFKVNFPGCLEVARNKPTKGILKVLLKNLSEFPVRDQLGIYSVLPEFPYPDEITNFLISRHASVEEVVEKDLLICLIQLGTKKGLNFCLERVLDLDKTVHCQILQSLLLKKSRFDRETTRVLVQRFNQSETPELKACYLSLASRGDEELIFSTLVKSLTKQPEPIVNAAIEALIELGRHEQLSVQILELYSNSRFYRLSMNVGKVYGIRFQKSQDSDALSQGMKILSYLLNEDSRDAQLAALEIAEYYVMDSRVLDWVSSLLLSESHAQLLDRVMSFLGANPGESVKQVLKKAYDRELPNFKGRVLDILGSYEDLELFEFFMEVTKTEAALEDPSLACKALISASKAVPEGQGDRIQTYLSHEKPEIQAAAIECVRFYNGEGMRASLERNYTKYTGRNRTRAATVLFGLGVPYVLDDLLSMLASEQPQDQKIAIDALHQIYCFVRDTPLDFISREVIDLLEIAYRETESRLAKESLLTESEVSPFLQVRLWELEGKTEQALEFLNQPQFEDSESFFLDLGKIYFARKLGMDVEPEICLRLMNQDAGCLLPYEILGAQLREKKRKTEFLVNQVKLLEIVHHYNGEVLEMLGEFSQEEMNSALFKNLLKFCQTGGLPKNHTLHNILFQVHINLRHYHQAFRHMCYAFLTLESPNYLVEFATAAIKCGYLEKGSKICKEGIRLSPDTSIQEKLKLLEQKIRELTGGTQ